MSFMRRVTPNLLTLAPFIFGTLLYFVAWLPIDNPSKSSVVLKCLPIISLIYFVIYHTNSHKSISSYQRRITIGLLFSAIGDAFLVWDDYFIAGMCAFGIAHLSYIRAFRQPYNNRRKGAVFHGLAALIMTLLYTKLNGIMLPAVFAYILIISIMGWYACAPVIDDLTGKEYGHEIFTCAGAITFIISDFVIAIDKFVVQIPFARLVVMSTYYLAQLLIALSAVLKKV